MRDDGASAVEYALLLAGIAVGLVLAVAGFEGIFTAIFDATCNVPGFSCT